MSIFEHNKKLLAEAETIDEIAAFIAANIEIGGGGGEYGVYFTSNGREVLKLGLAKLARAAATEAVQRIQANSPNPV